jgi:hypothetical protein
MLVRRFEQSIQNLSWTFSALQDILDRLHQKIKKQADDKVYTMDTLRPPQIPIHQLKPLHTLIPLRTPPPGLNQKN